MPSLEQLAASPRARIMIEGFPKAGKTGCAVALANAGWEIGILDFDNNPDPLVAYVKPECRKNVSIVSLWDKITLGAPKGGRDMVELSDEPTALVNAFKALNNWGKYEPEHDWGPVRTWDRSRILWVDSLTGMGDASFDRIRAINNRPGGVASDADFGFAMKDQDNMLKMLFSPQFQCHVICTAHLKMIGPKVERMGAKEDQDLLDAKIAISKANAEAIPTRWYPSALGRALAPEILRRLPAAILVAQDDFGNRKIYTKPPFGMPIDLGIPIRGAKDSYPQETGLLDIFAAVTGSRQP